VRAGIWGTMQLTAERTALNLRRSAKWSGAYVRLLRGHRRLRWEEEEEKGEFVGYDAGEHGRPAGRRKKRKSLRRGPGPD
jgi:hypothetical protein